MRRRGLVRKKRPRVKGKAKGVVYNRKLHSKTMSVERNIKRGNYRMKTKSRSRGRMNYLSLTGKENNGRQGRQK